MLPPLRTRPPPPAGSAAMATEEDGVALQTAASRAVPLIDESAATEAEPVAGGTGAPPGRTWQDAGLTTGVVTALIRAERQPSGWSEALCKEEAKRLATANTDMSEDDVAEAVVASFGNCRSLDEAAMRTPLGWQLTGDALVSLGAHMLTQARPDAEAIAALEGVAGGAQAVLDAEIESAQRSRAAPDRVLSLIRDRLERARDQHERARKKKESVQRKQDEPEPSESPAKRAATPNKAD